MRARKMVIYLTVGGTSHSIRHVDQERVDQVARAHLGPADLPGLTARSCLQ